MNQKDASAEPSLSNMIGRIVLSLAYILMASYVGPLLFRVTTVNGSIDQTTWVLCYIGAGFLGLTSVFAACVIIFTIRRLATS